MWCAQPGGSLNSRHVTLARGRSWQRSIGTCSIQCADLLWCRSGGLALHLGPMQATVRPGGCSTTTHPTGKLAHTDEPHHGKVLPFTGMLQS